MSEARSFPDEIRIPDPSQSRETAELKGSIERKLEQLYGSGTYISDLYEADSGNLSIEIGHSFPKDVSDCRPDEDPTIKFIAVDGIADLRAEHEGSEYIIEVESRENVSEGLKNEKRRLRENLGQAMARATYQKIARTPAVENQLNPIKQILRWTRQHHPADFDEVRKAQNKEGDKTLQYARTLENLGFIRIEDNHLYAEEPLDKYDLGEISTEEFNESILGEVVERGYKELSEKLGLNILRHLPKFANSYYFDAIERGDPELHLDLNAIENNLVELYGYTAKEHEWVLKDKMDYLASLGILNKDDEEEFYYSDKDTFSEVHEQVPV